MPRRLEIATLLYHDVTDDPTQSGIQRRSALRYKQSQNTFDSHLKQIAASGLTPGLVVDIDFAGTGRRLLLTFDDGGKSALHVGDSLCAQGWKGHFFVTTGFIGHRTFLDAGGIRYLRSCGHIVGTHSHTHPDIFRGLALHKMVDEWRISCQVLSEILGEACSVGSVPGGDVSAAVFESAASAGLRYLFTSDPHLQPEKSGGCWILGRACATAETTAGELRRLVHFDGWTRIHTVHQSKKLLKVVFSPLYSLYVDRTTRQ